VLFRLPPQVVSADPIRRRAERRFPWGYVLVALGGLVVASILGYALYLALLPRSEPPLDSFTTSERAGAIRMVKLDGGTFRMGSTETEPGRRPDEGPPHEVTISGPLLIAAEEITQSQYLRVVGTNPSKSAQDAHRAHQRPVERVSWNEANEFCRKLTEMERGEPWARKGWAFRLPTEAEWEYAARAGSETPFAFGDQIIFEKHALFLWSEDDPRGVLSADRDPAKPPKAPLFPQDAGKAESSRFGLRDMHGNVAEWCRDWYKPGYPEEAATDPTGPSNGDKRVIRGGSFRTSATETRSAARSSDRPDAKRADVGFRVVYAPEGT
jgi:formylglycine-generating enzyme required for sulfatase activity